MAEEGTGSMTDEATERGELRELLFDGVAPPPDTDAMFARTFAATGDDGAHLLPPDDLFDAEPDPADDLPFEDAALLDDGTGADLGDGDGDPAADDLADPAVEWSDPADVAPEATVDDPAAPELPDAPFDHPTSGW
jgi:hypothetical protein